MSPPCETCGLSWSLEIVLEMVERDSAGAEEEAIGGSMEAAVSVEDI